MNGARERLAELEREFGAPHVTMHLSTFLERSAALLREADLEASRPAPAPAAPAPVAAPAAPVEKLPLDEDPTPLSRKMFFKLLLPGIGNLIKKEFNKRDERIRVLQGLVDGGAQARDDLERRIAELESLIKTIAKASPNASQPTRLQ